MQQSWLFKKKAARSCDTHFDQSSLASFTIHDKSISEGKDDDLLHYSHLISDEFNYHMLVCHICHAYTLWVEAYLLIEVHII